MRIQILGINFAPENIGTAVYTTDLAKDMAERGHEVTVIAAHPYYPQWKIQPGYPPFAYKSERPAEGLRVIHCPIYVPRKPSGKSRILHYASFALTAAPRALWRAINDRPKVVFTIAPSLVSAVTGWAVARITGAKFWLHVQDFEVEAAFATGAIAPDSALGRAAVSFERWLLRRCDYVSTISAPMMDKLAQKGVPEHKTSELRNWSNIPHSSSQDRQQEMRKSLGVTTRYTACYSGNIAAKQGIEIIPAVARILRDNTDLSFIICGEGPYLDELKSLSVGLDNIHFHPLQPLENLGDMLAMTDIHLLPQIAGVVDLVLPSKLTNMLASGRPVIATAGPGTALANEVEGAGMVTPPGDARAMAAAIQTLLDNPDQRAELGRQARIRALERWNKSAILDRLNTRLITLTTPSENPNRPLRQTDI